ncbi:hypothetical protein CRUP_004700 [Coryphaenoides rupestris]|nr:hypothetical protein CRUP_004700 [Coryphaenoides rupestris]
MERLRREKAERQQKEQEEGEQAKLEAESREREETERQDDDEGERLTKEALEKRLQVEAQAQSGEQTSRTARGRRATRRTAGAPSEPDPAKDDGPATRTRSRSNSSNSVSSERSASRAVTPESGGRSGRGRGATQSHPPVVGATRESKRRRTTAGEMTPYEALGRGTRSRSNSNDSLNMDISTCSSSQSRDRGSRGAGRGRGRGRGRKTLPAEATSRSGQNEPCSASKATARGRKRTRLEATAVEGSQGGGEEKPAAQQSATTSGRPQTNATNSGALIVEEQDEEETLVTSSTTGRGKGRKAQKKCEPVETPVDDADGVEHHGRGSARRTREQESERREETPKRGSAVQGRRKQNEPQIQEVVKEEQEETIERKVRGGRQLVAKKKNKEEDEEVSAPSVTEQDAVTLQVTQTPAGKSSRKRGAAPVEASPMAKSPRASGASPVSRLPAAGQPCKVLFTGLVDEVGEEVVVRLGGSLALDVSDMTHLVTDKVRRTVKFLCAVARGIPVVTTQWLEKSGKARSFLSPSEFIVKDAETEKRFNFSLQESISIASNQPLLQGYQIHVTKSVKPEPIHMKEIISCCGASFLAKMPSSYKVEQTVVVSCEEDWSRCGPAVSACLPVVSAEFILTGILQQKADTEAHALRRPVPAPTTTPTRPAGARGRGRKRT